MTELDKLQQEFDEAVCRIGGWTVIKDCEFCGCAEGLLIDTENCEVEIVDCAMLACLGEGIEENDGKYYFEVPLHNTCPVCEREPELPLWWYFGWSFITTSVGIIAGVLLCRWITR